MRRLLGIGLAAALAVATAEAGTPAVPLPRPKPLAARPQAAIAPDTTTRIRRSGPDLAAGRVPLPRPRPARSGAQPLAPTATDVVAGPVIQAGDKGRISVSLEGIGAERDPDVASDLTTDSDAAWPQVEVDVARQRCAIILAASNIVADLKDPIGGPDGCGIAAPIDITAFGAVAVQPAATLNCTMGLATYKWLTEAVQPAARARFGEAVVSIRNASAYACRHRNNAERGRISEHAFGNALDVSAFVLASGRVITVEDGWSTAGAFLGVSSQATFLKAAHDDACGLFATVLGPRTNALHENHFHLDLGRGGRYKICQ